MCATAQNDSIDKSKLRNALIRLRYLNLRYVMITQDSHKDFIDMNNTFDASSMKLHPVSEQGMLFDHISSVERLRSNVNLVPDWSREQKSFFSWCPSRSLLASLRAYQKWSNSANPFAIIFKKVAVIRHVFWSVLTGADIPLNCKIGGGLLIPHPQGIVIHPDAVIGQNCLIFQQVTLGTRNDSSPPTVGDHVDIGAGAKVLGSINIGNHAKIGANAVVLTSVPNGKTAVGIPAVMIT